MQHIPGTVFVVGRVKPRRGGSILQHRSAISRPAETGKFKFNNQYLLHRIKPVENNFEYHFINQTTGEVFIENFSSTVEADKMIDRFMAV